MRRASIAIVVLLLAAVLVGPELSGAEAASLQSTYANHALSAYSGMQIYFYQPFTQLYSATYPYQPGSNPYSYHWPLSQATAATIDMAGYSSLYTSSLPVRIDAMGRYWDASPSFGLPAYDSYVLLPYGNGGSKFYDDNAWGALDLVRIYRMTGNKSALLLAEQVFNFAVDGWATSAVCSTSPATGGVFWVQQTPDQTVHDRNTVSTAPNAELGLLLYQITGQQSYLDNATQMYNWVYTNLRDSDGLYWDHVGVASGSCTVQPTKWSYNQGSMIGAGVLLYQITHNAGYLSQAQATATAALTHYGCAPTCNAKSALIGQGPAFNAIFFRNLLFLSSVDHDTAGLTAMRSYADLIWNDTSIHHTTRAGSLFYFHNGYVDLLDQAAMTEIYACLSWNPANYGRIL